MAVSFIDKVKVYHLLDNEIRNAFTATGSMHVLAVSGLHIGLILQLLLALIKLGARWINKGTG